MKTILSCAGAVLLAAGSLHAAEPTHELTREGAVKLIRLLVDPDPFAVEVAMILDGRSKDGPFEVSHARRVIAIHPVPEDGRRVRRMVCYDFLWNEEFGWFAWEKRTERGGDAIFIWSETRGELEVK